MANMPNSIVRLHGRGAGSGSVAKNTSKCAHRRKMRIRNYAIGYLDHRFNLYLGKQRFFTRKNASMAAWRVGHSHFDYFCVDLREIESEEHKETNRRANFLRAQYERLNNIEVDDEPSLLDRFKIQLLDMEKAE